jgi:hypothetical protein
VIGWAKTATGSMTPGIVAVGCVFLCGALIIFANKPLTRKRLVAEYNPG